MRILYASERPSYPVLQGGAARSTHALAHSLIKHYQVEFLAVGSEAFLTRGGVLPSPEHYSELGIKSVMEDNYGHTFDCGHLVKTVSDFYNRLSVILEEYRPDVVWSQLDGAEEVLRLSCSKEIPGVYYLRSAEFDAGKIAFFTDLGVKLVANSRFVADRATQFKGIDPEVVYPIIHNNFAVEGDPNGFITLINTSPVKGIETFLSIAKHLPNEKFLMVESWPVGDDGASEIEQRISSLPNVTFHRRVVDMSIIYGQTKLLLVPSVWEESFGRVVLEANGCGIPVIASRRGGLPETLGESGMLIDDYLNSDCWRQAIEPLLHHTDVYNQACAQARTNVLREDFSESTNLKRFYQICSDLMKG